MSWTSFSVSATMSPMLPGKATPGGHGPSDNDHDGKCELMGPFALLVQAALGALALLSLVYKRWRERPQRPVKIWAFDASKQVFGSVLLHMANLVMSIFSADQTTMTATSQTNPCSFYLLNLGIDTTLGIPILILILRVVNHVAQLTPLANPPESIESGNYGDPPSGVWWLKQSIIYFVGLLGMKTCVFFIIQLLPFIVEVGDWALKWTEGNTAMQIFFVMLLFPVIMNAIQYYIIDIFIKKPIPVEGAEASSAGGFGPTGYDHSALLGGRGSEEDSDESDDAGGSEVERIVDEDNGNVEGKPATHDLHTLGVADEGEQQLSPDLFRRSRDDEGY